MGATGGATGVPIRNCGNCNVAADTLMTTAMLIRFGDSNDC